MSRVCRNTKNQRVTSPLISIGLLASSEFLALASLKINSGLSHLSTRSIDPRERSDRAVEVPWIQSGVATCFDPTILTFDM